MIKLEWKASSANTLSPESWSLRMDTNLSNEYLSTLEGVSVSTIKSWRRRNMKLSEYKKCVTPRDRWTDAQVNTARNIALSNREVSVKINKSVECVRKWRARDLDSLQKESLKLLKGHNGRGCDKYEPLTDKVSRPVTLKDAITVYNNENLSVKEVAQLIGRPEKSVYYIREKIKCFLK
ncbi:MAG: hypothetical protein ACRCZ9_11470 [Fusobacteriaceae bacterium]